MFINKMMMPADLMQRKPRSHPNIPQEHLLLTTIESTALKEVNDFKYLDAWVGSTERDIKMRKALA